MRVAQNYTVLDSLPQLVYAVKYRLYGNKAIKQEIMTNMAF